MRLLPMIEEGIPAMLFVNGRHRRIFKFYLVLEKLAVEVVKDCNCRDCCTAVGDMLDNLVGVGSLDTETETPCPDALESADTTLCLRVARTVSDEGWEEWPGT